ncbi:MAG: hypothetical protein IPL84_02995 [Chitinophagaceae bacterium]|nr:hypothetical protein [Chitinophagaceae bacterium]
MKGTNMFSMYIFISLTVFFFSCNGQSSTENSASAKESGKNNSVKRSPNHDLAKGKGALSFKLDGVFYKTDPAHTKCWSANNIPLAILMAKGDGLSISWQMGYKAGETDYKLDGDSKGTINFTFGDKTYWTRSVLGDDYLNIKITEVKDKYTVKMLSGTFEGVLQDKEGNKIHITEGIFITDDI